MVYEVKDYDFTKLKKEKMRVFVKGIWYRLIFSGFDIETTKIQSNGTYHSYMYHWQLSLNNDVILGRTWDECTDCFAKIEENLDLKEDERMLMFIANTSFEFQFMRKRFNITRVFARERRQPLIFEIDNKIEVRDALKITGMSLEKLAKSYCKTQKLKGDLDYSIERNFKTPLSDEEKQYCINDVVILSEFSKYMFNKYIQNRFIPTTKTGVVREDVKKCIRKKFSMSKVHKIVKPLIPETKLEYDTIMFYLFRGGLTHCNGMYQDIELHNVRSYDKKSSYPYVMFNKLYPMTPFKEFPVSDFQKKIDEDIDNVIFIAEFENLQAKTSHTTLSYHKSKVEGKRLIDNGRIYFAEKCYLYLTEVDYKSMQHLYEWDKMTVKSCKCAKRGHLPSYLLDVLFDYFVTKEGSKADPVEYKLAKGNLNSMFGMCVTRYTEKNWDYKDEEWTEGEKSDYNKWREKQFLSPYWGIYITSYARADLERTIWADEMKDNVAYYDTDSNKHLGNHDAFFAKINADIEAENKIMCDELGYDFNVLRNIGKYEFEGEYKRFKTLGSKRYMYEDEEGIHSTVSGLGKEAVKNESEKRKIDAFALFQDDMEISPENVGKLQTVYMDDQHSDMVAGELMTEYSSVSLYEQSSHLNISTEYADIVKLIKDKFDRGVIF